LKGVEKANSKKFYFCTIRLSLYVAEMVQPVDKDAVAEFLIPLAVRVKGVNAGLSLKLTTFI
jgi:hypothetical protein